MADVQRPAAGGEQEVEVWVRCPYGNCGACLVNGLIDTAVGPIGCPCDLTPGWKSKRLDGMGKPHPPVLPKGRHRSRVIRARKRHELPEWIGTLTRASASGEAS